MTMFTKSLLAVSLGVFAVSASAQCSVLTVTGTGLPGTTLQVDLDATASGSMAFLLVGATQGTTTLNLGTIGSLTLGLATPFLPLPLGMTNATGDVSRSFAVPSTATMGLDVFGQGLTIGFSFTPPTGGGMPTFGFSTCTSNVVPFHVGA